MHRTIEATVITIFEYNLIVTEEGRLHVIKEFDVAFIRYALDFDVIVNIQSTVIVGRLLLT